MRVSGRIQGKRERAGGAAGTDDLPARAWRVFDVVNAKIEQADVKAGAILGACGIAAAAVIGLISSRGHNDVVLTASGAVSGIFVLMTAAFSCAALWPRRLRNTPPESLLYFDHIARRPPGRPGEYEDELRVLLADPGALTSEIVKQVKVTSHVAARKYDFLDRSMICFFGTVITVGITGVIFAVHYVSQ